MIWCDLDNTLIYVWDPLITSPLLSAILNAPIETKPPSGRGWRRMKPVEVPGFGSGYACRRKSVPEFLRALRRMDEVRMLTNAVRPYAEVMNSRFNLGFSPTAIVTREDVHRETLGGIDAQGILIDNASRCGWDSQHEATRRRKLRYLGIDETRVIEVPYFRGETDDAFEASWRTYTRRICVLNRTPPAE